MEEKIYNRVAQEIEWLNCLKKSSSCDQQRGWLRFSINISSSSRDNVIERLTIQFPETEVFWTSASEIAIHLSKTIPSKSTKHIIPPQSIS